jgi:exosortase
MKARNLLETWNRFHPRTALLPKSRLPETPAANFSILGRLNPSRAAIGLALGYLWFCVIASLKYEWTTDPQYSYGWVVPVLCLGLLVRRWRGVRDSVYPLNDHSQPQHCRVYSILIGAGTLAALYLPTRLLEGAVPEWRPVQWALGIEAVGLTLCVIGLAKGCDWTRRLAFPICFFLIAVPWPTPVERAIIDPLTRANSVIVVDLLGLLGVPAVLHGNVLEISTGKVGIDEACSGIRSLQTSLMISLFFGEYFFMNGLRRLWLIVGGITLAMVFNVGRMSLLAWVAARHGIAAMAPYHDPLGISTAVLCSMGLWGLAVLLSHRRNPNAVCPSPMLEPDQRANIGDPSWSKLPGLALGLLLWLVAADVGVHFWYVTLESHLQPSPKWSVDFPTNNPTLHCETINADVAYRLRFDEGKQAVWTDADGSNWKMFYFSWRPGRVAGYLAKRHTPEACLPAVTGNALSPPTLKMLDIDNLILPFRCYEFKTEGKLLYVFQCRWEAGTRPDMYVEHESTRYNLIRGVWAGRGNKGQKVLEVAVSGFASAEAAEAALNRQLRRLIVLDSTD